MLMAHEKEFSIEQPNWLEQFNPEQLHWINSLIQEVKKLRLEVASLGHHLSHRQDWHRGWIYELKAQVQDLQKKHSDHKKRGSTNDYDW